MSSRKVEPVALRGDEHQLFVELQPELMGMLRARLVTREQTLEDACGFAWMQFVIHQPLRGYARAWLYVVARHEALRLIDHEDRMTLTVDTGQWAAPRATGASGAEAEPDPLRARAIEALEALTHLPARQRRLLTLKVAGFSYRELMSMEGSSYSAVNRHLARARAAIRAREPAE